MKLSMNLVSSVLMTVIILIVIFQIMGDTGDTMGTSAGNVSVYNATGDLAAGQEDATTVFPLTSFFKKKGVVLLALMAGLAITAITAVLSTSKK